MSFFVGGSGRLDMISLSGLRAEGVPRVVRALDDAPVPLAGALAAGRAGSPSVRSWVAVSSPAVVACRWRAR